MDLPRRRAGVSGPLFPHGRTLRTAAPARPWRPSAKMRSRSVSGTSCQQQKSARLPPDALIGRVMVSGPVSVLGGGSRGGCRSRRGRGRRSCVRSRRSRSRRGCGCRRGRCRCRRSRRRGGWDGIRCRRCRSRDGRSGSRNRRRRGDGFLHGFCGFLRLLGGFLSELRCGGLCISGCFLSDHLGVIRYFLRDHLRFFHLLVGRYLGGRSGLLGGFDSFVDGRLSLLRSFGGGLFGLGHLLLGFSFLLFARGHAARKQRNDDKILQFHRSLTLSEAKYFGNCQSPLCFAEPLPNLAKAC